MAMTPEVSKVITDKMCEPELTYMRKGTLLNDDVCYHMINGEHDKAMEVISRNKNVSKTDKV